MIINNFDDFTVTTYIQVTFIKEMSYYSFDFYSYLNLLHTLYDDKLSSQLKSNIKVRLIRNGKMLFFIQTMNLFIGIKVEKIIIEELDLVIYNLCNKGLRELLKPLKFNFKIDLLEYFSGLNYLKSLKEKFFLDPLILYSGEEIELMKTKDNLFKNLSFFIECEDFGFFSRQGESFNNIFIFIEKCNNKNFLSVIYYFLTKNINNIDAIYLDFYCLSHFAKFQPSTAVLIFETLMTELRNTKDKYLIICNNTDHMNKDSVKSFYDKIIDLSKSSFERLFILNIQTTSIKDNDVLKGFTKYQFNPNIVMDLSREYLKNSVEVYDREFIFNLLSDYNSHAFDELVGSKESMYDFIYYKAKKIDFIDLEKLLKPSL